MTTLALATLLSMLASQSSPSGSALSNRRSAIFAPVDTVAPRLVAERDSLDLQLRLAASQSARTESLLVSQTRNLERMRSDSLRQDSLAVQAAARQASLSDSLVRFRLHDSSIVELDSLTFSDSTLRSARDAWRVRLAQTAQRRGYSVLLKPAVSGHRTGRFLQGSLVRTKDSVQVRLVLHRQTDSVVSVHQGPAKKLGSLQDAALEDLFGKEPTPPEPRSEVANAGLRAGMLVAVTTVALIVSVSLW